MHRRSGTSRVARSVPCRACSYLGTDLRAGSKDQRRRAQRANVCLVRALRSLGLAVPLSGPGPFRARTDGNRMLAPLGLALRYVDEITLRTGDPAFVCRSREHWESAECTCICDRF